MKSLLKYVGRVILCILIFFFILLSFSFLWAKQNYGNIVFEEIIFHLNMPLKGVAESFLGSYILKAAVPTAAVSVFLVLLHVVPSKYEYCLNIKTSMTSFN